MQKWEYAVITFYPSKMDFYRSNLFSEDQLKEIDRKSNLHKVEKFREMIWHHKLEKEVAIQHVLHILGQDGWELAGSAVTHSISYGGAYDPPVLIFKQPLEDSPS